MDDLAPPSAMNGVILTTTGETVATPTPAELAKLFVDTPKVGLNFAKIFDFDTEESGESEGELDEDGYETDSRPRAGKRDKDVEESDGESTPTQSTASSTSSTGNSTLTVAPVVKPTRLRRPSIRAASASAAAPSSLEEPAEVPHSAEDVWKAEYEAHVAEWRARSAEQRERAEAERARWEAMRAEEERRAKERARAQLDSRMEELQRRKSKFACL